MVFDNQLDSLGINLHINDTPSTEEIMSNYYDTLWIDEEKRIINENTFAKAFTECENLRYNNGLFYTRNGKVTEEVLLREIWKSVSDAGINKDVEKNCKKLLGAVKLAATVDKLKVDENIIPFANGDYHIDTNTFELGEFSPTAYRLKCSLKPELQEIPFFRKWLSDLFFPPDIRVIQEYLGYCLVPHTKAQKALFLVGEGGSGKSVIGVILEEILGDAMLTTSNTKEFMEDKFKLPELEHKLVLYDDDLDNAALTGTGLYKKLITNNLAITADRKYGQPFKFQPYAKLISCCNEMLTSIYDNTDGFYRRLLPIQIKPKDKNFKPDLHFYDKIRAEAPGILQWSIVGLNRLIENKWVLSESDRTKEYLAQKQSVGNHFPDFMESVFIMDGEGKVSSQTMLNIYKTWCSKNAITPASPRKLQTWIVDNAEKYDIKKSKNIPAAGGRRVNGYVGIRVREEWGFAENTIVIG